MNRKVLSSGVCALTLGLVSIASPALAKGPAAGGHSDGYVFYNDWSGNIDQEATVGAATDQVYTGDWNGDGTTSLATRDGAIDADASSVNSLQNDANDGVAQSETYWDAGNPVVSGDWNGDGKTTFGVWEPGEEGNQWYLRNELGNGAPDYKFQFGTTKDLVLVGDPDGKGKDAIVLRQGDKFRIHYADSPTVETKTFAPAVGSEVVGLGDWDGNGTDTPLIRHGNTFYAYDSWDSNAQPTHEMTAGGSRNAVLVGDWNGDGKDTVGLRNYEKPNVSGQLKVGSTTAIAEQPQWRLRADAAASWERVVDLYGQNFELSSAWRPYEVQQQLFEDRYTPKAKGGGEFCDVRTWNGTRYVRTSELGAAAIPGTSNHGKGQAIDVPGWTDFGDPNRLQFLALAKDFGWSDAEGCSVGERWHLTYDPAADKGTSNWKPTDPINKNASHCPDKKTPVSTGEAPAKPQCEP